MIYKNRRGYTLTELIVVMGIFLAIMMITATAFKNIVNQSSQQSKSVETQIEGIVGLEILRADLEQAGFGLPWAFQVTSPAVAYEEADGDNILTGPIRPAGIDAASFNDAPGNPPRAVLSGTTTFNKDGNDVGSAYLVIKSILAVSNDTSKKWTTISYDKDGVRNRKVWGSAERDLANSERVIIVKNSLNATPPTRELVASGSTVFSGTFAPYSSPGLFRNGDTFEIYGVNPNTNLRMPFNRADYYVARPTGTTMPQGCAPNTGNLYKSTVSQGAGGLSFGMPLLDCVADMQVVYGVDASGTGIDYSQANFHTTDISAYNSERIRNELREIRVYILAQEGKRDLLYSYPSETVVVGETFGGTARGRVFNLKDRIGSDYKYYRWKVYTIVVRPKNLIQ